jgi:hypothetical protein
MAKSYKNIVNGELVPKSRSDLPYEASGKGLRYSKCEECGEIFSAPGVYDMHRRVAGRMENYHRICIDPEKVGLILGERDVWITARDDDEAS